MLTEQIKHMRRSFNIMVDCAKQTTIFHLRTGHCRLKARLKWCGRVAQPRQESNIDLSVCLIGLSQSINHITLFLLHQLFQRCFEVAMTCPQTKDSWPFCSVYYYIGVFQVTERVPFTFGVVSQSLMNKF
jgi:hypothetical protein